MNEIPSGFRAKVSLCRLGRHHAQLRVIRHHLASVAGDSLLDAATFGICSSHTV